MKITIEENGKSVSFNMPEWALERRLILLAGVELVAEKHPESGWKIKTERCNLCGQCCMTLKPNSPTQTPYGVDDEGKCKGLVLDHGLWYCKAGSLRPYACLRDPIDEPGCSIVKKEL